MNNNKEKGCGKKQRSRFSDLPQAGRSGNRISVDGKIFRIRPDRLWGPPSLPYNVYRVSLPGIKRPGRDVEHPPPSSAEIKERAQL
jgi:hypothetical protein